MQTKLIYFSLIGLFVLSLSSCIHQGQKSDDPNSSDTTSSDKKTNEDGSDVATDDSAKKELKLFIDAMEILVFESETREVQNQTSPIDNLLTSNATGNNVEAASNLVKSPESINKVAAVNEMKNLETITDLTTQDAIRTVNQYKIPQSFIDKVRNWITYFTIKDRERFARFLQRGSKYKKVVEDILEENDMPGELYYLAMIESGYATHSKSRASAVGVWQFVRGTGQRYGLESNFYIDERRDPIRSTEAASKYLRDLYTAFQSWFLAMAAYNAGEHRILSAILNGKSRDYWELVDKRLLPNETRNYVPKFLAAAIIGRNLKNYNFDNIEFENFPDLELVEVPSPIQLKSLAQVTGLDLNILKEYNPHLLKSVTSKKMDAYEVWIPTENSKIVSDKKEELLKFKLKGESKSKFFARNDDLSSGVSYHKVRNGETLSGIATKYHVTIGYLKRLNNLHSSRIYAGKMLRVRKKSYHPHQSTSDDNNPNDITYYRVRKGDSLHVISRKFNTEINEIKKLNNMRSGRIMIGQLLKIPKGDLQSKNQISKPTSRSTLYSVKMGDSLEKIAKSFNTSIQSIKKSNNLNSSLIYAGQKLQIPSL